jgi:hypothetical protein
MNFLNQITRLQEISFACSGRSAAHIRCANCARWTQNDRAARDRLLVSDLPNPKSRYIKDGIFHHEAPFTQTQR